MKTLTPISEIYQQLITRCLNIEEQDQVFGFVREGNLQPFIDDSIVQLEGIVSDVQSSNHLKIESVKTIAYSFLKEFNQQLSKIVDLERKAHLKELFGKITRGIISEIHQQAPTYADQIRSAIKHGLLQAVHVERYNQKDFVNYMQLDYINVSGAKVTVTNIPEATEYLVWNPKGASLESLASMLQGDYKCIKSKNELLSLFAVPPKKQAIRWDKNQTDLLLLLFDSLLKGKYIELKGARGRGMWKVILGRFVDFDQNSLKVKPAKRISHLKKEKLMKPTLAAEVEKIINNIKVIGKKK